MPELYAAAIGAYAGMLVLGQSAFDAFDGVVIISDPPDSLVLQSVYCIVAGATVASAFWFVSVRK